MLAPKLNQRITIQAPATGQNEYGEPVQGWTDVFVDVAASIQDLNGHEFLAAAAVQNATTSKVLIRHLDGVLPAMRVMHGAVAYDIQAVLGQDRRQLLLMCSRGVGDG